MKSLLSLRAAPVRETAALTARPASTGLTSSRTAAQRALDQTRAEIQSGAVAAAAANILKQFEDSIAGLPPAAQPGLIAVRLAASADSRAGLPAVPLAKLRIALKVRDAVLQQEETNSLGLAFFSLPTEPRGAYQLDALSPDGAVLATAQGRWTTPQSAPVHLLEAARADRIKAQLERAMPFEKAILTARQRAKLAQQAVAKALAAQEKRLVAYAAELDTALTDFTKSEAAEIAAAALPVVSPEVVLAEPPAKVVKKAPSLKTTDLTKPGASRPRRTTTKSGKEQ